MKNFVETLPVPLEKLQELICLIKTKENITIIAPSGIGLTSLGLSLQEDTHLLRKKINDDKLIFIYIDYFLPIETLDKHIATILSKYVRKDMPVGDKIMQVVADGFTIFFVIDSFQPSKQKELGNIMYFQTLSRKYIKFIYCIYYHNYISNEDLLFKFSQNIIKLNYLDDTLALEWLKECTAELDISIDEKVLKQIVSRCGGIPVLLKNTLRLFRNEKDADKVFSSMEYKNVISKYFGKFLNTEKKVLYNLLWNIPVSEDSQTLHDLKELNIVDQSNNIKFEWVKEMLITNPPDLKISKDGIVSEQIDFTEIFTDKELDFFKLFTSENQYFVTRDEIVKFLWGENYREKFSNWALDQLISRLRKKLNELGYTKPIFKTFRNKGFKLLLEEA